MVRDAITDGKRIAQLLASELTGLETGPLENIELVDVDENAEPSETGTRAYRLAHDGDSLGAVYLFPETVEVHLTCTPAWPDDDRPDIVADATQCAETSTGGDTILRIESGATVKRAVDVVRTVSESSR